jgi:hypothetical protein
MGVPEMGQIHDKGINKQANVKNVSRILYNYLLTSFSFFRGFFASVRILKFVAISSQFVVVSPGAAASTDSLVAVVSLESRAPQNVYFVTY